MEVPQWGAHEHQGGGGESGNKKTSGRKKIRKRGMLGTTLLTTQAMDQVKHERKRAQEQLKDGGG